MKRFLSLFLALLAALSILPGAARADSFDPDSISTPYVCLMDSSTGTVLYERGASERAFPASTTKIMTCILAIELAGDLGETVNTGSDPEGRGSTCNFSRNEEMPLIDMLYGMMLFSGNDAARAIAEHFGETESGFVEMMNQKAVQLGMTGTHFVKSNGLHKDEHYSTAHDMALLTRYAMKNETFRKIVSSATYDAAPTNKDSDGYQWYNSNRLLYTKEGEQSYTYPYAIGVKTGDTAQAGRCLVAAAKKDGIELILVLLGDYEHKVKGEYRFINAAKFFDWGFENFTSVAAGTLGLEAAMQLPVSGASLEDAEGGLLTVNIDFSNATLSGMKTTVAEIQGNLAAITTTIAPDRKLTAPVEEGEKLGSIAYQYNGSTIFTAPYYASRAVAEPPQSVTEPSSSPILIGADDPDDGEKAGPWLFWALLAVVLVILVIVAKLLANRRRRKRIARKRSAHKRVAYRSPSNYPRR